jgi:hypothetical protein
MLVERAVDMVAQNIFGDTGLAIAIRMKNWKLPVLLTCSSNAARR